MAKWDASIEFRGTLWTNKAMTAEIRQAMKATEKYAKEVLPKNSPVDKGNLIKQWSVKFGDRTMTIRNSAYYAGFVNYGTRRIKPRRFLEKSVDQITEYFKDTLADLVEQKLGVRNTRPTRELAAAVAKLRGVTAPKQHLPQKLT